MKKIAIDEPARLDRFVKSFGANHSEDFKGLVLKLVESGQSLEQVSALSGVSLSTLYDWVKDWNEKKRLASTTNRDKAAGPKRA
jgi:transposase